MTETIYLASYDKKVKNIAGRSWATGCSGLLNSRWQKEQVLELAGKKLGKVANGQELLEVWS